MVTTLEELDKILVEAESWLEHDADHFVAMTLQGDAMPKFSIVPGTLLVQKHPDFPRALLGLIEYSFKQDRESSGAYGYLVFDTLDVLQQGTIHLDDVDSKPRDMYAITELKAMGSRGKAVSIEASFVDLNYVNECGHSVPFVTNREVRKIIFMVEHISSSFPGWITRWTVGKELGLENAELLKNVFSVRSVPETLTSISDVIFD